MRSWDLAVDLASADAEPIFLRIARAIADDVRRGRLARGAQLPGTRTLAASLGVHRNTVLAAYRELSAEGWIESRPAGGTFVSAALPDPAPRRFARSARVRSAMPARVGFDLGPAPERHGPATYRRGTLVLAGGVPDLRLVPTAALSRAYRRALRLSGRTLLAYGDPRGDERLRVALASMMSSLRGLAAQPEHVVVTRGSQMGLDLVARALVAPGDVVAVEAFGYRPAWAALRQAGAHLVPVPVDRAGIDVDALGAIVARERVRAVYVTPHHQYPTTVVMAPGRRMQLLALAAERRIAILEDDYDFEFHYDGRPVLPLASADRAGVVVYVGTLSKILAPGLRIGFVVAPAPLVERIATLRTFVDRQGDHAIERAVAELLEDGEVQRHARRVRRAYESRRDALVEAIEAHLARVLDVDVPAGGIALWARVEERIDPDAWLERSLARGVAFTTGRQYAFDGRQRPFVRLGFAALDESELRDAARRMAAALR